MSLLFHNTNGFGVPDSPSTGYFKVWVQNNGTEENPIWGTNLIPSRNAAQNLGSPGRKYKTIYAESFEGVASNAQHALRASSSADADVASKIRYNRQGNITPFGELGTVVFDDSSDTKTFEISKEFEAPENSLYYIDTILIGFKFFENTAPYGTPDYKEISPPANSNHNISIPIGRCLPKIPQKIFSIIVPVSHEFEYNSGTFSSTKTFEATFNLDITFGAGNIFGTAGNLDILIEGTLSDSPADKLTVNILACELVPILTLS